MEALAPTSVISNRRSLTSCNMEKLFDAAHAAPLPAKQSASQREIDHPQTQKNSTVCTKCFYVF